MENRDNKDCSEFEKEYIRFLQEEIKSVQMEIQRLGNYNRLLTIFTISILGGITLYSKEVLFTFFGKEDKFGYLFEFTAILLIVLSLILMLVKNSIKQAENISDSKFTSIYNCERIIHFLENELNKFLILLKNEEEKTIFIQKILRKILIILLILTMLGLIILIITGIILYYKYFPDIYFLFIHKFF
jgi:hypothetical protein